MPVNKNALSRYHIIDACLRNNMRKWTKAELLNNINEKLLEQEAWTDSKGQKNISERQLNYDLNEMKSKFGAPIEQYKIGAKYYYRYTDSEFSIDNIPLSNEDLEKLRQAVSLLHQLEGFSISEEIDSIVTRIEKRLKMGSNAKSKIIAFENAPYASGLEYLDDLFESIIHKRVLKISYKPYKASEPKAHIIHPYFIKEYNNRWFLFGLNQEKDRIDNMPLDRIVSAKVVSTLYIENVSFDSDEYFSNIIGVTKPTNASIEEIVIKVSAELVPYFITKPLHRSQKSIKKFADESEKFGYSLIINKELERTLLGCGSNIEIIKPMLLREKIVKMLEESLGLYQSHT